MLKVFADRGGTFTDLVIVTDNPKLPKEHFLVIPLPHQQWIIIHKLLSENPEQYPDAVIQGIRDILGIGKNEPIPTQEIEVVKMGTTVATNALLERKGDRVLLAITKGFRDALRIGYQNRPDIFALEIILPSMLYEQVIEIDERYDSQGNELIPIKPEQVTQDLQRAYDDGIRSLAIVLMHSYAYPNHEKTVAKIAQGIGFTQISVSHQVSPLIKLISRGDTTVVDAYLSPILRRYVQEVSRQLPGVKLMFMKSDGGLVDAHQFQGKDSILSGPAGGIVGAVQTSLRAGFQKIITFDMGGTSTDVAHFKGEYERQLETEIAGARMRVPVLDIHTVAAGGGSLLFYDGQTFRVGPESAGANPGPACYRRGGNLTITDANVMLGKIYPQYFPSVFGTDGKQSLDKEIVIEKFTQLAREINSTPEQVASGFVAIAVENMANAVKKISLQRGYDVSEYTLCVFGGAGAQVACLIADTLGMKTIFIHPYAGVLSAYGMGLADVRSLREMGVEKPLTIDLIPQLQTLMDLLVTEEGQVIKKVNLKYEGTNSTLMIDFNLNEELMRSKFEIEHQTRYGFTQPQKALIVESVTVEVLQEMDSPEESILFRIRPLNENPIPREMVNIFSQDIWHSSPVYPRQELQPFDEITGPAIIVEKISTIIIEPNWNARLTEQNYLILQRI